MLAAKRSAPDGRHLSPAAEPSVPRWVRSVYWAVVVASVGWTIANRKRFGAALEQAGDLGLVLAALSLLTVLWGVGLAVVCFCVATRTARSLLRDPLAWIRSSQHLGRESLAVLTDLSGSRPFWLGWWGSWAATTVASVIPAVVAVVRLGASGLGIVGLAVVSIAVNVSWRLPIELRLQRLRASRRNGVSPAVSTGV